MNKILNINLGGYALTIDDDAYEHLSLYLESIRRRFSESEGRDEIMHDIESRLGEIIHNSMGNRTIVMLPDVEAAIEVMGKPEDFGGEPMEKPGPGAARKRSFQPGKKLYRDEDDAVIGGVCSGLAAYFGFQESIWMRLIFVLLGLISFGFWIPAYILLWILVPPARTAAERLAMRGETANVENIAREIEQGFERVTKRVNDFGSSAARTTAGRSTASAASGCLTVFGKLVLGFVIFVALAMVFGLGTAWVAGIWAFFTAAPYISYFSPLSSGATYLGFINAFFLIGIPVVALVLWLGRTIFRFKTPAWLGSGMSILWVINFVSLLFLGGWGARGFRHSGTVSKNVDFSSLRSDTLHVKWSGVGRDGHWIFDDEDADIHLDGSGMKMTGLMRIHVRRSTSGRFECTQTIRARGATYSEAVENAAQTNFETTLQGNNFVVPTAYDIREGHKWRVQEVKLTIYVPEGKFISFGDVVNNHVRDVDYADPDNDYYISEYPGQVFLMTDRGLACPDCPGFGDRNYRNNRRYERFILEGNFETEIIEDDDFSISFEGDQSERNKVETIRGGDDLTLTTRGKILSGLLRCIIRTPVFTSLYADKSGPVTIRGFNEGQSSITVKGPVSVRGFFDSNQINLSLNNKARMELIGKSTNMEVSLIDGSELEATGWRTSEATISASQNSRAQLTVDHRATVRSDASSNVQISGGAEVNKE